MKAIIILGYVLVSLFISGFLFLLAKLLTSYYNNFIHHDNEDKRHLDTGLQAKKNDQYHFARNKLISIDSSM